MCLSLLYFKYQAINIHKAEIPLIFVLHQLATARITALSEVSEYNTGLIQCNHSIDCKCVNKNDCDSGLKLRMILSKH